MESMVSTSSQLVPEESVGQLGLSTREVRWQWYRAHPSVAPDLGRCPVALPGVAGSASVSVEYLKLFPCLFPCVRSLLHRSPSCPGRLLILVLQRLCKRKAR